VDEEERIMAPKLAFMGVPSSAGAHMPGQEKAPNALREAGLLECLGSHIGEVIDYGDLPRVRHTPDKLHRRRQNVSTVLEVARRVAERVDRLLQDGAMPLVLGGDCTITLGVLTGFLRHYTDLGLLYFDTHVDLNTPASTTSGVLDSMGMVHMLGEANAVPELSHMGPRFPLLLDHQVVFFLYVPHKLTTWEQEVFQRRSLCGYAVDTVAGRAATAAANALQHIEAQAEHFLVHFDVDAMDSVDFPLADVPQLNHGLTFHDAMVCLKVFVRSPQCVGLIITEVNPDRTDEEGVLVRTFVEGIAEALTARRASGR
jgi:arginase